MLQSKNIIPRPKDMNEKVKGEKMVHERVNPLLDPGSEKGRKLVRKPPLERPGLRCLEALQKHNPDRSEVSSGRHSFLYHHKWYTLNVVFIKMYHMYVSKTGKRIPTTWSHMW